MKEKSGKLLYTIILILIFVLIISGCGSQSTADVEQEKIIPVNVALSKKRIYLNTSPFPEK